MKKLLLLLFLLPFLFPQPAYAHAFGKLYNLPIPFWMYLYGGAAALIVSFVVIGFFINQTRKDFSHPTLTLAKIPKDNVISALKKISVFLFFLTIASGTFGINEAYNNFNMTFFWIIIMLGLTYATLFIGNVYAVFNPWAILAQWFQKLSGSRLLGFVRYPKVLGYYPALLFYFLFIWFELIGQTTPATLSAILVQYTIITIVGVWIFGKESWLRYGEFFSVFFRLIGKMSLIEYDRGKLFLRPPFVGLVKEKADHFSLLLFILFMLSSTAFDGFRETTPWVSIYWNYINEFLSLAGGNSYVFFQTIGLLLSPLLFLLIYISMVGIAKILTRSKLPFKELLLQFALPLVPIAFVYNVAHYYTLLLSEGLNIVRLVSDPFGWGWNLFGTADYYQSIIPDANFVWHSQVAFILLGHIVGVYLSHIVALRIFSSHKKALISQFPMLVLMVIYTMIGLWILSQPIASGI